MLISRIRKNTQLIIWMFLGIFLIFGVFLTYGMLAPGNSMKQQQQTKTKVPKVVLKVDGYSVPLNIFEYKYIKLKQIYESQGEMKFDNYPMRMYLKSQVADILIAQELFIQEAKKRNMKADSAEVAKKIQYERDTTIGPGSPAKAGTVKERLQSTIQEKEREEQFRAVFTRLGISYDTFKETVRRDVIQEKVMNALGDDLMAAEKDRAKTKAQGIVDKLSTGEPFENVAKQFSEDETTKENGGDLGWIKRGILPATMEDAAFALNPGEVSQPVESQIGLHVIKLIEKKTATGADFEAAKPEITAKIRERLNDELAEVSEDQIKKEYEEFHAQHIMIRTKTREQLAVDWVTSEKNSGNHKIEIVNPELKAYRYVMQEFLNPTAGKPDLDQAITLYEKAIDVDPRNAYLYFQLGSIYEQKNTMARVGLDEEGNDPYSFAIADSEAETAETEETEQAGQEAPGEEPAPAEETQEEAGSEETAPVAEEAAPKDPNIYLQEALEAYEQANNVGEETSVYDPMIMISEARIAQKLGKDDSAVERFSAAIDFSVGNMSYLNQIKEGLSEYETETAQKAIDETDELIAELEDLQSMADEPYDEAYEDEMDEEDEYLELETEETTPESDVPVIEENPGSESISAPDTSVQDYEEIPIQTSPAAPVEPAK